MLTIAMAEAGTKGKTITLPWTVIFQWAGHPHGRPISAILLGVKPHVVIPSQQVNAKVKAKFDAIVEEAQVYVKSFVTTGLLMVCKRKQLSLTNVHAWLIILTLTPSRTTRTVLGQV